MAESTTTIRGGAFTAALLSPETRRKLMAFTSLILIVVIFSLASPNFFQTSNLMSVLLATAVNGVLAVASTFIIITGGIDLSVGTAMTFTAVISGVFITMWHLPMWTGILMAPVTGMVCGLFSGTFVTKLKIPPFIATLGMMMVTKGLSMVISGTKPIYFTDTPAYSNISLGSVVGAAIPKLPMPNAVLLLLLLAVLASLVLNKTLLGRYTFALGSNEEAVRLSGVNVDRWKIAVYAFSGILVGMAGLLISSRLNSAQPALGQGYELDAIAAVVIGGTSLSGGEGTILGTIIGAFIISTLTNGLRILSVPQEWQTVVTGVIIIIAVYLDILRRRRPVKGPVPAAPAAKA
jgi:ribose transport system permease protein